MSAATNPTDRVVLERVIAAPRALVWDMWTDPAHFAGWYGPTGATIPVAEFDLRIGGNRRVCMAMETPNGPMQMWFGGQFETIEPPERLSYTEYMCDEHGNAISPETMGMPADHPSATTIVIEFTELGNQTRMTMTHIGIPEGSPGASGWNMAFDKLEQRLAAHRHTNG